MKCILLALFVAYASASVIDQCSWGESYWCSSLKIAKQCGAVQHCIDTVWSHQKPYEDDNSNVCQYCENIITDVKNFVDDKQRQEKIQKYLDQACSVIPVSELADECKEYVDNNLPEIFQMISAKLDPKAICSTLHLCKAFEDTVQHAQPNLVHVPMQSGLGLGVSKVVKTGDVCTDCKTLIQDLQTMITSSTTEKQVEDYLKQNLCSSLGALETECGDLVDQYTPEILQLLSQEMDPATVCEALGLCGQNKKGYLLLTQMRLQKSPLYKAAGKIQSAESCLICKTVLSELQSLDRDPKIQKEVEDFLKNKLCTKLGSLEKECMDTVDQYGSYLFEFLVNELDPNTRCESLGFCSSAEMNMIKDPVRLATPAKKPIKAKATTSEGATCVLCEFVMREIDGLLKKNSSEVEIEAALKKVCSLLPDTIKEECDDFVDQYAPAIIELLAQELDPQQVCTMLGLCKTNRPAPMKKPAGKVSSGESCGICETVMQYVDSLLEENATVQEIEDLFEKICNFLPGNIQKECDDFIEQYGPTVIELLIQVFDPKTVCTELGLCPAAEKAVPLVSDFVNLGPAVPLLGQNKCTWGPAHWCSSRENAEKCKAVEHCEKHGWINN